MSLRKMLNLPSGGGEGCMDQ